MQLSKKQNKWKNRFLLIIGSLFFIAVSFFLGREYVKLKDVFKGVPSTATLQRGANPNVVPNDHLIHILLLGIGGDGYRGADLTDAILIVSIDPFKKKAALLSIPRDLWIFPQGFKPMKINALYAHAKVLALKNRASLENATIAGFTAIEKAIEQTMGLAIHYHVRIDFAGFRQVIDAIGGVDIDVDPSNTVHETLWDTVTGKYYTLDVTEGPQHFDGQRALHYARSRFTSHNGDFSRNARQRKLVVALKEALLSFKTLTNPFKISQLTDAIGNHMETNMSLQEIISLYHMSKEIKSRDILSLSLTGPPHHYLTPSKMNDIFIVAPHKGITNFGEIQTYIRNSLTFEEE
jgi:LCP family protein required for cell wall assembly